MFKSPQAFNHFSFVPIKSCHDVVQWHNAFRQYSDSPGGFVVIPGGCGAFSILRGLSFSFMLYTHVDFYCLIE